MRNVYRVIAASTAALGFVVFGVANPALATTNYSSTTSYTANGVTYSQFSTAVGDPSSSGSDRSDATVSSGPSHSQPAYYMGGKPRTLNSSGAICRQPSDYTYNTYTNDYAIGTIYGNCGLNQLMYGYGLTKAYNGNGYSTYYTTQTPYVKG